jgi:hypothetical protein
LDHFSPSYFALLGPYDRAKLSETVIPENFRRVLEILSVKGIRYLLAGNMALALHGIPRLSKDLDLLVDSDLDNLERISRIMRSEGLQPDGDTGYSRFKPEEGRPSPTAKDESPSLSYYLADDSGQRICVYYRASMFFAPAFERRISIPSGSMMIDVMSLEDLILIKVGSDDPADLADAKALERVVRGRIKTSKTR